MESKFLTDGTKADPAKMRRLKRLATRIAFSHEYVGNAEERKAFFAVAVKEARLYPPPPHHILNSPLSSHSPLHTLNLYSLCLYLPPYRPPPLS